MMHQNQDSDSTSELASKLLHRSEESFLSEYQKYDKNYKTAMYLELISIATKNIISGEDIYHFEKCLQFIICIHEVEKGANSKEFNENVHKSIKSNNLIILASKYNRIDIVKHILNEKSQTYTACIRPGDKDNENHNAFYYAIRKNSIELLKVLHDQWLEYVNSEELNRALAEAYEELKLKNIDVSNKLGMFIAERLIYYQLYSDETENEQIKISLEDIEERGKLLVESIQLFIAEFSNTDDLDDKLLLRLRFIISNIHILKQQMKATYSTIFWEEMEFCLTIFLHSKVNNRKQNMLIYKFSMTKSKLLNHLDLFANMLANEMKNISSKNIDILLVYPNTRRAKTIPKIIKSNPKCKELYEDFQRIKDAYCLHEIKRSLELSSTTDPLYEDGQLAIKRTLQLISEMMKNNWESPNMSRSLSLLLLTSLPLRTRQIVVNFHNSSSVFTQTRKLDIEFRNGYDDNDNIFKNIQEDLNIITWLAKSILHVTIVHYITIMIETMDRVETPDDLESYLRSLDLDFDIHFFSEYHIQYDKYFAELVEELRKLVCEKSAMDKNLFKTLKMICKTKGLNAKDRFTMVSELTFLKSVSSRINEETLIDYEFKRIKTYAKRALINKLTDDMLNEVQTAVPCILYDIIHNFGPLADWRSYDQMMVIVNKIHIQIGLGLHNLKWLENLRTQVYTKKYVSALNLDDNINFAQGKKELSKVAINELSSKLITLKNIFINNRYNEDLDRYKNSPMQSVVEILTLEIMSIFNSSHYLADNYIHYDQPASILVGKTVHHHIAHCGPLPVIQRFSSVMAVFLNAKELSARYDIKNCRKIGRVIQNNLKELKLTYSKNLSNINNQNEMFQAIVQGDFKKLEDTINKGADIYALDYRRWTSLHYAAKGGNYDIFKHICDQLTYFEMKASNGQTPLHIAVKYRHLEIVKLLINKVKNYEILDKYTITPLCLAVRSGYKEIVETLLPYSNNEYLKSIMYEKVVMQCAALNGQKEIVEMLLKHYSSDVEYCGSDDKETLLHIAAKTGNDELTKYFINLKADVNSISTEEKTPLHYAASLGFLNTVKILISNQADVNARSLSGSTPLDSAVENKKEEIVKFLLDNGAIVNNTFDGHQYTALHLAAKIGSFNIVKLLIDHKAAVNTKTSEGQMALHLAAFGGHYEIVELLIKNKALIKVQDNHGNTPVHSAAAAINGNSKIVELLLRNGAQLEKKNNASQTPLHLAADSGNLEIVKILVERGANFTNSKDKNGLNALHFSVQKGHLEIVKYLISKKANINMTTDKNISALCIAASRGYVEIVKALVEKGADLEAKNEFGLTALHLAIMKSYVKIVEYLLSINVNVMQKTPTNKTALHLAAENNHIHIVDDLLKISKELVYAKDNANRTALYIACSWNHSEVIKLLIKNGAEIIYDKMHCMEIAIGIGNKDVVDVLLNFGINVNDRLAHGIPFLHRAVQFRHYDIIKNLIAKKVDVNAFSLAKETALMIAAENGDIDIVITLLKNKANPDLKNDYFQSSLDFAIIENHLPVFMPLFENSMEGFNYQSVEACSLLHIAAVYNSAEICDFLLDQEFDPNHRDKSGRTPLHYAAVTNSKETVDVLVLKGGKYNVTDEYNRTPQDFTTSPMVEFSLGITDCLFKCVKTNNYFGCLECLQKDAFVNAKDRSSLTPLHYASLEGFDKIVRLLLSYNAHLNISCKQGTPLHFAVKFGHYEIVKILLMHGAIYDLKNELDQFPMELTSNTDIVNLFKLIEKSFTAVKNRDISIVDELMKIEKYDILKCILSTYSQHVKTFYIIAKRNDFPEVDLAKIYGYENYLFIKTYILDTL